MRGFIIIEFINIFRSSILFILAGFPGVKKLNISHRHMNAQFPISNPAIFQRTYFENFMERAVLSMEKHRDRGRVHVRKAMVAPPFLAKSHRRTLPSR